MTVSLEAVDTQVKWDDLMHGHMIALTPTSRNLNDQDRDQQLQPICQFWQAACLYVTHKLRVVFTFSNSWVKNQKNNILCYMKIIKFKFQCWWIEFYWIPIFIPLYNTYACICATVVELSSLKYLLSVSLEKKFADPWFRYSKM